jgi:monoamine oxidase
MARTPLLRALRKLLRQHRIARRLDVPADTLREALQRRITRRAFVAGGAALATAAALPRPVRASGREPRIAIVGGGIAGLNCALTLADRGIDATIYEAATRIGGRMFSNTDYWKDGQVTEWGGELIDTGHRTIRRLAKRFDLKLDDVLAAQPDGSTDTYYLAGHYYSKAQADADFAALASVVDDDLSAAGYPTTYDSYTPEGKLLDDMSIAQWIDSRVPGGRSSPLGAILDLAYAIEYGADSTDQSALNLLYLLGYQPVPNELAVFGESDERFHIRGGNDQLPRAIACHLGEKRFELGQRLVRVAQTPGERYRLTFKSIGGDTRDVLADYVVLALPFSVLREIDCAQAGFDALKHQAIQELGLGRNGKTQLQFDTRLWNTPGPWGLSNGSSYSDTGYQSSWEPTRGQKGDGGVINFYSGGSVTEAMQSGRAFATASNPNARADALDTLARAEPAFPGLSAQWNGKATQSLPHLSPLMRASYAYYRVGQYTTFGGHEGVRQGGVLFCGDHTSQDFQGFMEGGASEGRRAGRELAGLLRR